MLDPQSKLHLDDKGNIPVERRRILLTQWAGRAWRHLEALRKEEEDRAKEAGCDPDTLFRIWRAF